MTELEQVLKKLEEHEKFYTKKLKEGKGNPYIMRGALHAISIIMFKVEEMLLNE